jgi:translation initiation factor IF-1
MSTKKFNAKSFVSLNEDMNSEEMDNSSLRSGAKRLYKKKPTSAPVNDASLISKYHPFVIEQLKKHYTNTYGKECYNFKVGGRLPAFEKFFDEMTHKTGCQFFANSEDSVADNSINIVANDIESLADGIKIVADVNTKLKTHGVVQVSRDVPIDSNLGLAMAVANSSITTNTPAVSYTLNPGSTSFRFTGPADQLAIVADSFVRQYEAVKPKERVKSSSKSKASSKPMSVPELKSVPEPVVSKSKVELEPVSDKSEFMKRYLARLEAEAEAEADTVYDEDGNVVSEVVEGSASTDAPVHRNSDFKPPSKAEQMKRVKSSGGSKRIVVSKMSDFEPNDSICHGLVTKLYGGQHVEVKIITRNDPDYKRNFMAHISGSMSRKSKATKSIRGSNRLEVGSVVLISKRDFQDSKVDVVQKIPSECIRELISAGYIHRDYASENPDRIGADDAGDDATDEDCGFVFEDI